jgi:flagellar basal body-associated protein FliL
MHNDEILIEKAKKLFESSTGWGDSEDWTNQDFVILSEKIQERTGVALSHVTLKRVWGKVKYESLPNTHTLDTLVQFLGYENWREFKSKNGNGTAKTEIIQPTLSLNGHHKEEGLSLVKKNKKLLKIILAVVGVIVIAVIVFFITRGSANITKSDYSFSSKKIVSEGVPNSVIFNYDATKSPYESVIIQQSWDKKLQSKVSKYQHQHTSIYYYPDYYKAKLIVGNKIVSTHRLLIKSNGWLPIVTQSPVPIYFEKKDVISGGKMSLSIEKIQSRNIKMQPVPPTVLYSNVRDFGEIYSDNFVFETSVRNDYNEGASACQLTTIYLLCEGTAVGIPLCAKGCISNIDLLFTNFYVSGKQADLSAFGVDFNSFVKVRVESKNHKAIIMINDKLVYTVNQDIIRSKIVGFDFIFQGTGSVDYVKLLNDKVNYEDDF